MTLKELKCLGRELCLFLAMFSGCFRSVGGRRLLKIYVQGQLSDIKNKNCEAIALKFDESPRTLQRFLESIKWDEEQLRDRCQQIIARDHTHEEAIGTVDESGNAKSGDHTAGASRQYNGNRGKIENCTVGVHLGYSTPGFRTIVGSRLYLPKEWAEDAERRKQNYIPDEIEFQTKPEIALDLIDQALGNGIKVAAWTFDELYGRNSKFLDALDQRGEAFVAEIPSDTRVWTSNPKVRRRTRAKPGKGRPKKLPCRSRSPADCEVRNLIKYSSKFQEQSWQRYHIKDTEKGPDVWEVKWLRVWRKTQKKLPSKQQTLIVARNVRTGEVKYFLSNRVVGRGGVTLRWLLRVAFSRWSIEACFRVAKEELGVDHFQVRGWRCIHRNYYVTGLSYLFCSRIRQRLDKDQNRGLTVEQVRGAVNIYLAYHDLPPLLRDAAFEKELDKQYYHQDRNTQARKSHTKTRIEFYRDIGIDVDKIRSCIT
ncbi:MAG: IS701 family transposase [Pirellulaceae bacterium]